MSNFWLISDRDNRHFTWRHKHINYGRDRYILVTKITSVPLVTMVTLVTKVISFPMKAMISSMHYKFPLYGHFRICFVYLEVCHLRCVEQMAIKGVSFRQNTTMYLNYCIFYYCIQVTSFF